MKTKMMKYTMLPLMAGALVLSGCAEDSDNGDSYGPDKGTVEARMDSFYPRKLNQAQDSGVMAAIPTTAPVVIQFDKSVYDLPTFDDITFEIKDDPSNANNTPVEFDIAYANESRTLLLIPKEELKPFSEYYVYLVIEPNEDRPYDPKYRISKLFETRGGDPTGPVEVSSSHQERLIGDRAFPYLTTYAYDDAESRAPHYPFSPYVMAFSQPIDESTVSYGDGPDDTVKLIIPDENDSWPPPPVGQGQFIDASVEVAGNYMVVEPEAPLDPEQKYRVVINDWETSNPVRSVYGNAFRTSPRGMGMFSTNFGVGRVDTPEGDWPKTIHLAFAGGKSPITDAPYNTVPPGREGSAGGIPIGGGDAVEMQIDFIPRDAGWYEARSPFVLSKETIGKATLADLQATLAGDIQQQGMSVEVLSDPVGMIMWETLDPYVQRDVRDTVEMYMILGLVDEQGNVVEKAFIEMLGYASGKVEDGDLSMTLFGATDPEVLGQQRVPGNGLVHLKLNMTEEVQN